MGPAFGARGTAWEGGTQKSGGVTPQLGLQDPINWGQPWPEPRPQLLSIPTGLASQVG